MKQHSDSKKRVAFPIHLSDGGADAATPREIHIVPTGEWEHWSGEKFSITQDTVRQLKRNFDDGVRKEIPITAGHDFITETPAVGWFTELIDRGANGLYGLVKWNDEGLRLLSGKMFKYFSAELAFGYRDLETEKKYDAVLVGGALTNKPFFKQLDMDPSFGFSEEGKSVPHVFSFSVPAIMNQFNNSESMDIKEILAKKPEDLSVDEKAFLVEHKDELTDEQKGEFASVIDEPVEPVEEPVVEEETPAEPVETPAPIAASEKGTVTISASELESLKAAAEKGAQAHAKIAASERAELVGKLVFSSTNKAGRFLPKQKDAVESFVASLSEEQRTSFSALIQAMPESKLFSEIGDAGATAVKGIGAEVEAEVKKLQASDTKLSYGDAMRKVFAANPELHARYLADNGDEEQE